MNKAKILFVDDEQEILNAFKRALRRDFDLTLHSSALEAIEYLQKNSVDIIVSDMRMPEMDGAEFLAKAKTIAPDSVRILITGFSEMEATIRAINEGQIYSYIAKPWDNEQLKLLLRQAASHRMLEQEKVRLTQALMVKNEALNQLNDTLEKKVEERTKALKIKHDKLTHSHQNLRSLYKSVLSLISHVVDHSAAQQVGHASRVAAHCGAFCQHLELDKNTCTSVQLAGQFHQLSMMDISAELINIPFEHLTNHQKQAFVAKTLESASLISVFPPLNEVAKVISQRHESYCGKGLPNQLAGEEINIGARILRIVADYDLLIHGKMAGEILIPAKAKALMLGKYAANYDLNLLKQYFDWLSKTLHNKESNLEFVLGSDELFEGLIASKDILNERNACYLSKNTILDTNNIDKLRFLEKNSGVCLIYYVKLHHHE